MWQNSKACYGFITRVLHTLVATGFILQFFVVYYRHEFEIFYLRWFLYYLSFIDVYAFYLCPLIFSAPLNTVPFTTFSMS